MLKRVFDITVASLTIAVLSVPEDLRVKFDEFEFAGLDIGEHSSAVGNGLRRLDRQAVHDGDRDSFRHRFS